MPERGFALNGAKRHGLVNPSFSAADTPLFCRAFSVGVTFLDATHAGTAEPSEAIAASWSELLRFHDQTNLTVIFDPLAVQNQSRTELLY
jgi:hypothetical protein